MPNSVYHTRRREQQHPVTETICKTCQSELMELIPQQVS